eukprot:CAMPEP_0198125096 /NCGR_PEP_ID=MMETSP1442-20131203/41737_1 /TAXON_ID= /ORGANISM="Craspedostauros australis, Strain CCMP3328" /LENGTH=45 /DNA_ID= /DNA_START= /DNA_END= /DNA_ORIENTATION=
MTLMAALSSNNQGTFLIRSGMYDEAVPEFKRALQLLQKSMEVKDV